MTNLFKHSSWIILSTTIFQAIANGTVAAYQQKCQETKNSYAAKRQMLYNPSNEMKEIFRRIYNKESLAGIR